MKPVFRAAIAVFALCATVASSEIVRAQSAPVQFCYEVIPARANIEPAFAMMVDRCSGRTWLLERSGRGNGNRPASSSYRWKPIQTDYEIPKATDRLPSDATPPGAAGGGQKFHLQRPEVLRMKGILVLALALYFFASPARALTVEDLQGITINARMAYDMRIRRAEGEFPTQMTMLWVFKIDEAGRITGNITRTVTTPRGPRTQTNKMQAKIGKPGEPAMGGHGLWLIEGEKLVLLRAFDAGGFKAEIDFAGTGSGMKCSIRAPFVREEGARNIRTSQSVVGGPVTILRATQKSADCRISR